MTSPCENCWNKADCLFKPEPNCNDCRDYYECMRQREAEEQEDKMTSKDCERAEREGKCNGMCDQCTADKSHKARKEFGIPQEDEDK